MGKEKLIGLSAAWLAMWVSASCSTPELTTAADSGISQEGLGENLGQSPGQTPPTTAPPAAIAAPTAPSPPQVPVPDLTLPTDVPGPAETPQDVPGLTEETACVQQSVKSEPNGGRPIDILFVIDNSDSMGDEIQEVQKQINQNFANIIAAAGVDYRIAMVSAYGPSSEQATSSRRLQGEPVCVTAPLGAQEDNDANGLCDVFPYPPVEADRFQHFDVRISSFDGPCRLLQLFDGGRATRIFVRGSRFEFEPVEVPSIRAFLRPDALKLIVFVTDDEFGCDANQEAFGENLFEDSSLFDADLVATTWESALQQLAPEQFGATPENRQYSVWSIIGAAPFNATAANPGGVPAPQTQRSRR